MKALPPKFFRRDTEQVARELLGKKLLHLSYPTQVGGIIIETEAYLGVKDRAAHSFGGRRTKRVESMYLPGGHAYVYLIYGIHYCINVVTKSHLEPEAVLIRAVFPTDGLKLIKRRRKNSSFSNLCSGPGKLCQALAINRSFDGESFSGPKLLITENIPFSEINKSISTTARIGIENTREARDLPLRFTIDITDRFADKIR